MAVLGDFVGRVQLMMGNRHEITDRVFGWLQDAYLELGMSYPFEELEDVYEYFTEAGVAAIDYPVTALANASRTEGYATRAVRSAVIINSTTSNVIRLRKKNPLYLDLFNEATTSRRMPSVYATTMRTFEVRPIPDDVYKIRLRLWLKPLINYSDNNLTQIDLPDDWWEIMIYLAAAKGYLELLELDRANTLLTLLHGAEDPRSGRREPGLIHQRLRIRQAESFDEEYNIQPLVRRYTSGL